MKRSRGRGRRPQGGSNHSHSNNSNNNNNPNRTFDSTGPEVKIRGSAAHVYEKYLQLARDANSSGDRVMAESYLQHAEHYFRILSAMQAQQQTQFQNNQGGGGQQGGQQGQPRPYQGGASGTGDQPFLQTGVSNAAFSLTESESGNEDEEAEVE